MSDDESTSKLHVCHAAPVSLAPPCQASCPAGCDVRAWIGTLLQQPGRVRTGDYARAWRLIVETNPFPASLGRICTHPCETHCNCGGGSEPLAICAMERFLGDHAISAGYQLERRDMREDPASVGVVGAGPCGLSFAWQMARRGYRVSVYDANEAPGGMLRYGIPDYRLPHDVIDAEAGRILALGVRFFPGVRLGYELSLGQLRRRHRHVFLAIGAQQDRPLGVPGAEDSRILGAADYLRRVNRGERVWTGQNVVVIGGGSSAVDAARCARRSGARVVILYRHSLNAMTADGNEIQEAVEEGVELMLLTEAVWIERSGDGRSSGVYARHLDQVTPVFRVPAELVIAAVGRQPALDGMDALPRDARGRIVAGPGGMVAPGIWIGGDMTAPGGAAKAVGDGRMAAERVHARWCGRPDDRLRHEMRAGVCLRPERSDNSAQVRRPRVARLFGPERVGMGMREVSAAISEADFLAEAERCLSRGTCRDCESRTG